MNTDLDKLAAELQDMKPSKSAKDTGMSAAMAAFDAAFAAAPDMASEPASDINSENSQGLNVEPRPTPQTVRTTRVETKRSGPMAAFNSIFNMSPKTAMMGSGCVAALLAALVIMPANPIKDVPPVQTQPIEVVEPLPTPTPPVSELKEAEPTAPDLPASKPAVEKSDIKVAEVTPPIKSGEAVKDTKPAPDLSPDKADASLPSNVAVIERRVIKTPAQTVERVIPPVTKMETRRVVAADGTYKTVQEPTVVQEASTELVTIPPTYETVRETIELQADGSTKVIGSEVITLPKSAPVAPLTGRVNELTSAPQPAAVPSTVPPPPQLERSQNYKISNGSYLSGNLGRRMDLTAEMGSANVSADIVASSQAGVPRVSPAAKPLTKTITRRVVKTPASTQERIVPAITKDVEFRVEKEDGSFETVTKTVVVQEATTELITIPPTYQTVTETVVIPPNDPSYYEPKSRDQFENYESNPVVSPQDNPVSTFSVDVDTASYSFLRSALNRGQLPPPGAVRLEEMINYFPYDYTAPRSADTPFNANVTVTETPWNSDTKLMHIGIKGYVPPVKERPDSNIVFLIDTSGSMRAPNKLPLLISSFKMMLKTLDEDDTVSIVTYAGSAGTVLDPTPASDKDKIHAALNNLRAGGSTAGAAGLELAYIKAKESFKKEGSNRVILATDGDFNVGFSSHEEMKTFIETKRKTGVFLSVLGFGNGNYNDQLMQALAQNGNGIAAYIDTLSEANKVLGDAAGGALLTIAKDVKIQVEFNPATIAEYRLIGYETRALKRQDFNNDKVDAGDIGAGHSVTAVYEITPVGSPAVTIDKLRYVSEDAPKTTGSDEYAFVKIRHKLPDADTSTLQTFPVGKGQERRFSRASNDARFATAVAAFGQKLRGDSQVADYSYGDIIAQANKAKGEDKYGYRAEFIKLVRLAEGLSD